MFNTYIIYFTGNYIIPVNNNVNRRYKVYNKNKKNYNLFSNEDKINYNKKKNELNALENPRIIKISIDKKRKCLSLSTRKKSE